MDDKQVIKELTAEVISLRKQLDKLTPKLYQVKAWHNLSKNGTQYKSFIIDLKHECYSQQQAHTYLDNRASRAGFGGLPIYTSVEQIDYEIIEDDWVNQLAKKLL